MTYSTGNSGSLTILGKALQAFIVARDVHETDNKELRPEHVDALKSTHPMSVPVPGIGEVRSSLVHRFSPDMELEDHNMIGAEVRLLHILDFGRRSHEEGKKAECSVYLVLRKSPHISDVWEHTYWHHGGRNFCR